MNSLLGSQRKWKRYGSAREKLVGYSREGNIDSLKTSPNTHLMSLKRQPVARNIVCMRTSAVMSQKIELYTTSSNYTGL